MDAAKPSRSVADRLFELLPLVGIAIAVVVFYGIEAHARKTVWYLTDELEWTQISRSIAATGHAARRSVPFHFKSIYPYLIAPAWRAHSTVAGYALVKYTNELLMLLAAVPSYLLARMLVVRRWAIAVALLTISIPEMSYATSIVPETFAYTWFVLCAWLSVRALARPTRWSVSLAIAAVVAAPLVRKEFIVVPVGLALAALPAWVLSNWPHTGPLRSRGRRAAAAAGLLVIEGVISYLVIFIGVRSSSSLSEYLNRHTFHQGALPAGALTVGIGVIPVIAGLASLWLPERSRDPVYRAFASYFATTVIVMVLYAAGKATYLIGSYGPTIEERNVFYVAPLFLMAAALAFSAQRLNWWVVAAATGVALYLVWPREFQLGVPYPDAVGLAALTFFNGHFGMTVQDVHRMLTVVAAGGICLLVVRRYRWAPIVAALFVGAWMVNAEIEETRGNDIQANVNATYLPAHQFNWVDRATGGGAVTYVGEEIVDGTLLWETEFWNRTIQHVESLDNSAPGPGPRTVPVLIASDGLVTGITTPYVLAYNGVAFQAKKIASHGQLTLFEQTGSWKLLHSPEGVYPDGWVSGTSAFNYFKPGGPGTIMVTLSRQAYTGAGPAGHATITVGSIRVNKESGSPEFGRVLTRRHAIVRNGSVQTISIPVARTPVRVELTITPTLPPRLTGDSRDLGAIVAFAFKRR